MFLQWSLPGAGLFPLERLTVDTGQFRRRSPVLPIRNHETFREGRTAASTAPTVNEPVCDEVSTLALRRADGDPVTPIPPGEERRTR